MTSSITRRLAAIALSATLAVPALSFSVPAIAGEGNSIGHGVKCYWVLVSSVNGANTYQQVCRKGV